MTASTWPALIPEPTSQDLPEEMGHLAKGVPDRVDEMQRRLLRLERVIAVTAATSSTKWSLSTVLQEIVNAARDLVGAGYSAFRVVGPDGQLELFVHSGMDDESAERIGVLPSGRGILGVLIDEPVPLRLGHVGSHPASVGFPPGHPRMGPLLSVPVQVAGEVFGNLYLTEPVDRGEFTGEDEALAMIMAATAGGAIANARRLAESEQRRRWLTAAGHLSHQLLAGGTVPALEMITNEAAVAADADIVTITMPAGKETLSVRAASGHHAAAMKGKSWPIAGTLCEQVMRSGKPAKVDECGPMDALGFDMGPAMVVPLVAGDQIRGTMSLTRATNRPAFTVAELDMVASFSHQATLALELIDARADQQRLAVLAYKERMAEDLHDHVIGELFATGMSLQSLAGELERSEDSQRLSTAVESMDNVIQRIRTSIFQLQLEPDGPEVKTLRTVILDVAAEHESQLCFSPDVQFSGPLDWVTDPDLTDDILAVTREALSNCARHAQATAVTVVLAFADDVLALEITDNGRGIGQPDRSSGLTNMRHRAERHQGTLAVTTPEKGGTRLSWTAHVAR